MSIIVRDRFLEPALIDRLADAFQQVGWQYGWNSDPEIEFSHWHHEILGMRYGNTLDQQERLFTFKQPNYQPVIEVWKSLQAKLFDNKAHLLRCYANLHTHGVEGYPHVDADAPGETTIILYLNRSWDITWGGETAFYEDDEIVKSVMPRYGRMVMFPSETLHCARAVSRACPISRKTMMFKLKQVENQAQIDFLIEREAHEIAHTGGRSLLRHLRSTYEWLKTGGESEDVCLAGLFHSVYGTSTFKTVLIPDTERDLVREQIGEHAEDLVYRFHQIDRPECFLDGSVRDEELLAIEVANLNDQGLSRLARRVEAMRTSTNPSIRPADPRNSKLTVEQTPRSVAEDKPIIGPRPKRKRKQS
jgi:SM-20-related protein